MNELSLKKKKLPIALLSITEFSLDAPRLLVTSSIVFLFKGCWASGFCQCPVLSHCLLDLGISPAVLPGYVYNRKISMEREIRKLPASKENYGYEFLKQFDAIRGCTVDVFRSWVALHNSCPRAVHVWHHEIRNLHCQYRQASRLNYSCSARSRCAGASPDSQPLRLRTQGRTIKA